MRGRKHRSVACSTAVLPATVSRPSGTSLYTPTLVGRIGADCCNCSTGPLARSRNPDAREKKKGAVPNAGNCRQSSSCFSSPLASPTLSRVHDAATRHPTPTQQLPQPSLALHRCSSHICPLGPLAIAVALPPLHNNTAFSHRTSEVRRLDSDNRPSRRSLCWTHIALLFTSESSKALDLPYTQ
jgi:hypothetical protein